MSSQKLSLKLYVCGLTPSSEMAITNVCALLKNDGGPGFDLEIIDVLDQPALAEKEHILATPTLIKEHPLPREVIIGDLSEHTVVRKFLGLNTERDGNGGLQR
jgi:circadian clock protein KaiB